MGQKSLALFFVDPLPPPTQQETFSLNVLDNIFWCGVLIVSPSYSLYVCCCHPDQISLHITLLVFKTQKNAQEGPDII
jgi:hypothetical protein